MSHVASLCHLRTRRADGERAGQVLLYRCQEYACRRFFSVLHGSVWEGMRLDTSVLARCLRYVTKQSWLTAVTSDDLVANVPGIGRRAAHGVLRSLREAEALVAKTRQHDIHLTGNLEGDATGLRHMIIKRTNPYYQKEIRDFETNRGKKRSSLQNLDSPSGSV